MTTPHTDCTGEMRRRALLLPIVLLIVAILALLAASFGFYTRAELNGMSAVADQYQARLAAEAGLQRMMLMLRTERFNPDIWYNNEDELHRVVVWLPDEDPTQYSPQMEVEEGTPAWYYDVVADDPLDDEPDSIRYGITPEAAKLNVNSAPPEQLRRLFTALLPQETNIDELVDSLIDWRDGDDEALPNGAESEYYGIQEPPTRVKNGPLESVEELLLVRGFTPQIVYGEDMNRNGILDNNEDDGELTLPIDNTDGELFRGLYPYLTTMSREFNTARDNQLRVNLLLDPETRIDERLGELVSPSTINFLKQVRAIPEDQRPRSELELYGFQSTGDNPVSSPITIDELPAILDLCTLRPTPVFPDQKNQFPALVDVNTAPAPVLQAVGLSADAIQAIQETRLELTGEQKQSVAWLISAAGLPREQLIEAAPYLTARGIQFTVETIGYAEHLGSFARIEAIIELRGQAAAIMYLRDLTSLGIGYPVRLDYGDGTFARQASR